MKRLSFLCVLNALILLTFCLPGYAQTQTPPVNQTWSASASAIALPGNKTTLAATLTDITFAPDPDWELGQRSIITGAGSTAFLGGFRYYFKPFSTKPVNGTVFSFRLSLGAYAGVDRVTDSSSNPRQHWAFIPLSARLEYDFTKSGKWGLAIEGNYARLPGIKTNTGIVALGPVLNF